MSRSCCGLGQTPGDVLRSLGSNVLLVGSHGCGFTATDRGHQIFYSVCCANRVGDPDMQSDHRTNVMHTASGNPVAPDYTGYLVGTGPRKDPE